MGDSGATYTAHLRLVGKFVVDFLLLLIELFSPGVTADWKSAFLKRVGQFLPNFHVVGDVLR